MSHRRPPRLANWLLAHCFDREHRDALIGDLMERHHAGKSAVWYWRQTVSAIVSGAAQDVCAERWLLLRGIGLALALVYLLDAATPQLLHLVVRSGFFAAMDRLTLWLVAMDLDGTRHTLSYLRVAGMPMSVLWCAGLASATWIATRLHPRQRHAIVDVLIVWLAVLSWRSLGRAGSDWLEDPTNPIWISGVLWQLGLAVAALGSILTGAAWARTGTDANTAGL